MHGIAPAPCPHAMRSLEAARRSLVTTAEVAALAGLPGDAFDELLNQAREAFRAMTKEMAGHGR